MCFSFNYKLLRGGKLYFLFLLSHTALRRKNNFTLFTLFIMRFSFSEVSAGEKREKSLSFSSAEQLASRLNFIRIHHSSFLYIAPQRDLHACQEFQSRAVLLNFPYRRMIAVGIAWCERLRQATFCEINECGNFSHSIIVC